MENYGKVSVIMGIYNCETTLEEAVNSIRNQTYENWELILCDDGSSDNTYGLAQKIAELDERIIVLKNSKNEGLNHTLNVCLSRASGDYIARMDGDDLCVPERFEKQLKVLMNTPEYQIVSSGMTLFDENGAWGTVINKKAPQAEDIISGSPICHAPVMMKRECMDKVHGYTENKHMLRVEDVNLWIKLYVAGFRCFNIQEPLYLMRNDKNALNRRKYKYRINSTYVRLLGCKDLRLGPKSYIKAFIPMIVGLIPAKIRHIIRKHQRSRG